MILVYTNIKFNITLTFDISIYKYIILSLLRKTIKTMVGTKGKSGGKREGAGKPKGINQKAISVRIDLDLISFLDSKENRNRFINECIRERMEKPEQ